MKKIINVFFLFFIITSQLYSQDFWTYIAQLPLINEFSANSQNNIFAGTNGGVYRSTNNGDNWALSLTNITTSLAINSQGHIYAGTYNGVYLSTDNGVNWTLKGLNNNKSSKIAINSLDHIFLADSTGFYRSTDNGNNWVMVYNGASNPGIVSVAINHANHIFVGTGGKIYRSADNGTSWALLVNSPSRSCIGIGLNSFIYAGTPSPGDNMPAGHIHRSTDNGETWNLLQILSSGSTYTIGIHHNGYIFAAGNPPTTFNPFVYYSSDNGDSWNDIGSGLTLRSSVVAFGFANNGYIYCSQSSGKVYRAFSALIGIVPISNKIPESFSLSQNYPNPFNPSTNIKFQLPRSGFVKLTVFDILGKEVQTLVNEQLSPGTYGVDFPARIGGNGSNLPSGVYYYKLEVGEFTQTKKMVLIK